MRVDPCIDLVRRQSRGIVHRPPTAVALVAMMIVLRSLGERIVRRDPDGFGWSR